MNAPAGIQFVVQTCQLFPRRIQPNFLCADHRKLIGNFPDPGIVSLKMLLQFLTQHPVLLFQSLEARGLSGHFANGCLAFARQSLPDKKEGYKT